MSRLITVLDGYVANYFEDFTRLDQSIKEGKAGSKFGRQWKETRFILSKMSESLKLIPKVGAFSRLQVIARSVGVALMGGGLVIFVAFPLLGSPLSYLGVGALYSGMVFLAISWFSGWKTAKQIDNYFMTHAQKYRFGRLYIRERVQELLFALREHMRKAGMRENQVRIQLYNSDYKGIRTAKKGRFSKRYIASVDLEEP